MSAAPDPVNPAAVPDIHSMPTAMDPPVPRPAGTRAGDGSGVGPAARGIGGFGPSGAIGPYRLVSLLGEGGFGTVYLAEQSEPVRRRVALKIISGGLHSDLALARFEAERHALALMDHPGVAAVYDAGLAPDGRPYFVMEHVPGQPITTYATERGLSIEARIRLLVRVCEAVQHAHQKGVIHRDLKPGNILVAEVDGRPHPKVIDFGVAKALHQPLTDTPHRTIEGQVIGTPEYMAPEQARGDHRDIDTRADIYSLGAVLYELLTGHTPVEPGALRAAGLAGLAGAISGHRVVRPSERVSTQDRPATGAAEPGGRTLDRAMLVRRLRGDLDWIVMCCLEKDRERRYGTAGELAAELSRYLRHEPVLARPPGLGYRATKFVRRHRLAVASAAVVALALLAGVTGTAIGLSAAIRERDRALEREAEARAARDESEAVTEFLSNMLGSVAPDERGHDVRVREVLDEAAASIPRRFADRPVLRARLSGTIAGAYRSLGAPEAAEAHLEEAYRLRRESLGEAHPLTIRTLANIAGLRHEQGRIDEAVEATDRALRALDQSGSGDAHARLGIMNNLAQSYARLGRRAEAESLQRRVVAEMASTLGPEHADTLGATVNLASLLVERGDDAEGQRLLEQTISTLERVYGEDHPGTLTARHVRATHLFDARQDDQAEPMLRQVAAARARVLGPDHADTIGTATNLGLTLTRLGRTDEAERILGDAFDRARRVLGESHPTTLQITMSLLGIDEARGWPARPDGLTRGRLEALRAAATSARSTPHVLNTAAWYLLHVEPASLRDPDSGLRLASLACERARTVGSADLWMYLDTLAEAQFARGQAAEALATQTEAIALIPASGEQYRAEMESRRAKYAEAVGRAPSP